MKRTFLIAAAAVVAGAALLWHPPPRPVWVTASPSPPAAGDRHWTDRPGRSQAAVVYVAGEVAHPGLYSVPQGARAADAVKKAGGLLPNADAAGVNLAERVADGAEVEVDAIGQRAARTGSAVRRSTRGSTHRRGRRRTRPGRAAGDASDSPPEDPADGMVAVDVNAADVEALAQVPGLGRSIAGRIVEMRERAGPFSTLDELLDVNGVTQSRLERARPYLRAP